MLTAGSPTPESMNAPWARHPADAGAASASGPPPEPGYRRAVRLSWGRYVLDSEAYELLRDGDAVSVEPQVLDVLTYLARHRDRVVPKGEILDEVWGDRFVSESALTTRIKAARRAVGDDGKRQEVIRTVHGRGYRFVAPVEPAGSTVEPVGVVADPGLTEPETGEHDLIAGRDSELRVLHQILDETARGSRRIVFVAGPAGMGKTTLLEGFVDEVTSAGSAMVATGNCVPQRGSGEAYLPVLNALSDLGRTEAVGGLVNALSERAPSWLAQLPWLAPTDQRSRTEQITTGGGPERMLRELLEALEVLTVDAPLLLALEDLHWSDPSTLDFLDALGRSRSPARVLVVGTYRPADSGGDPDGVHTMATELTARGASTMLRVRPLDAAVVDELVSARIGREARAPELIALLTERTGGVPLFVRELLEGWMAEGVVRIGEGGLDHDELAALVRLIPTSIRDVIEQTVDRLDPDVVALLEAASVVGPVFAAAVVAAACDRPVIDVEQTCQQLARRDVVIVPLGEDTLVDLTVSSTYGFAHDLFRDVIYRRIPAARRAHLHLAVGRRLELAHDGDDTVAAVLASHFVAAHDLEAGVCYSCLAAERQLRRSAHREALEHLGTAEGLLRSLAPSPARDEQELRLLVGMGNANIISRGYSAPETVSIYERARTVADRIGEGPHVLPVLYGLWNNALVAGALTTGHQLGETFLRIAEHHGPAARLVAHRAVAWPLLLMGDLPGAAEHLDVVIGHDPDLPADRWTPFGEHPVIAGIATAAWLAWLTGDRELAFTRSERAVGSAQALGHPFTTAYALLLDAVLWQWEGDIDEVDARAATTVDTATEHGIGLFAAWALVLQGWVMVRKDRVEEGLATIDDGLRAAETAGALVCRTYFLGVRAEAQANVDMVPEAGSTVDEALGLADRLQERFYEPRLRALRERLSGPARSSD